MPDVYDLVHRAQRLQRELDRIVVPDPLARERHRHQIMRVQVADVVRMMRYAGALGEVPQVTQQWAQLLEDALDRGA
jgi:hypothetical protein